MNAITQMLLAGAALGALATAPAVAENAPHFGVVAVHAGHVVNKTRIHNPRREHFTSTFGVYTYVPASDLHKTVPLYGTFYQFTSPCMGPPVRVRAPKRTAYAKIDIATETWSEPCGYPGTGATYKLTNPAGEGQTDHFVFSQTFKFKDGGVKYKGTINFDVSVSIGQ